jgi:hypothetical protein
VRRVDRSLSTAADAFGGFLRERGASFLPAETMFRRLSRSAA